MGRFAGPDRVKNFWCQVKLHNLPRGSVKSLVCAVRIGRIIVITGLPRLAVTVPPYIDKRFDETGFQRAVCSDTQGGNEFEHKTRRSRDHRSREEQWWYAMSF